MNMAYYFVSFKISLSNILEFSVYRFYICFVKFIPEYFMILETIVNGIFIWIFSCSLLIYGNSIDFYILTLYPRTLLDSTIPNNNFCSQKLWTLQFSTYRSCCPWINVVLHLSDLYIFYFLFLDLLHRLGPPAQCWIGKMKMDILLWFLVLGEKYSVFCH